MLFGGIVILYKAANPTKLTFNKERIDLVKLEQLKPLFICCGIIAVACGLYLIALSFV